MGVPPSPWFYLLWLVPLLLLIAIVVTVWWLLSRRRLASEAVERARSEADRLIRQAERDAETLRKEAALEARE